MDTPGLKKAMTTLEFLSQDKEARLLYEARKKALLDEQSALDYVESRGEAKGKAEVAANMLQEGLSIPLIAKVTGLSGMEVEALKNRLH